MEQRRIYIFCFVILLSICSCSPVYKKYISNYHFDSNSADPDYSNLDYWAANPYKKSLSDSIPEPLRATFKKDTGVDVFFIHPTTYINKEEGKWNASINDSVLNAKTDYSTILYQASAFNEYRIFAPRYRQANILAYYTKDTITGRAALRNAYKDVRAAFLYYLEHYNHGRPVIIASHSQGSTHAIRLLREFFDDNVKKKKLIAAYIPGMTIKKSYFTYLTPCKDSSATGCFVGWRTFKVGYEPDFVKEENGDCFVTNPLTWTTTDEYAPKSLNKGGVLTGFNKIVPEVADAQIHDDVLWTHKPHFPGSFFFRRKNYHVGDINLYYMNIRENLRTRVKAFESGNRQ
ncbi:MAG: DUF3089 domain-containing protein [Bacteroidota bacterium]